MGSNLDCIGIRAPDPEAFSRILGSLAGQAVGDAPPRKAILHARWTDLSGASVAFHLRQGEIECVTPFFNPPEGLTRWRVKTSGPALDPACAHCCGADCDILGDDGQMITRAAVQFLNFTPYQEWLREPRSFEIEVVAFAHQPAFYATGAEYEEGQRRWWSRPDREEPKMPDGRPMRFADSAFLPEGMFSPPGASVTARATALFAGRVEASRRLTNRATGLDFQHVRVRTLTGLLDSVMDPASCEGEPECGRIAFIRAWLVGRPAVPPPEAKRPWWKGLFGK